MESSETTALPPIVLAFAATDPSGGAGLQADVLTLASMGCHPLSVVTAATIQDTMGVEDIMALDPEWVADQARCVLEDMPVTAIKIGVIGSIENITAIATKDQVVIGAAIQGLISAIASTQCVIAGITKQGLADTFARDQAIGISAARELLIVAPARDQRVIPGFAKELLTKAIPAPQAISAFAAIKFLRFAIGPCDQRVIPGFAKELLTKGIPAPQAISAFAAIKFLKFAIGPRDQRVIPSIAR